MKAFMLLLYLVPLAFLVGVLPIAKILIGHIRMALVMSKEDEWASYMWWNWWGSWLFCAGPFGRWIIGTILGYMVIKGKRQQPLPGYPGQLIEEPHLRVLMTAFFAALLSIFAVGLAIMSMYKILCGLTFLESLRPPSPDRLDSSNPYLVCLPRTAPEESITINILTASQILHMAKA
ncbi:hypothetical protein JR316_0008104 [Psilocybe cubensis]|uniref:Uncharacterized protein n=1 Tax=Psilocybe cubensis TaxID=181762 RepID=A0ACB8GX19_PSICU|nr:hypothetical protein JR316_0008104 [Psilocybe cubensis]KAH9479510.1 hypothetical protein JR316_0008104 [Psilocybe cubensis]